MKQTAAKEKYGGEYYKKYYAILYCFPETLTQTNVNHERTQAGCKTRMTKPFLYFLVGHI